MVLAAQPMVVAAAEEDRAPGVPLTALPTVLLGGTAAVAVDTPITDQATDPAITWVESAVAIMAMAAIRKAATITNGTAHTYRPTQLSHSGQNHSRVYRINQ